MGLIGAPSQLSAISSQRSGEKGRKKAKNRKPRQERTGSQDRKMNDRKIKRMWDERQRPSVEAGRNRRFQR
jgi:hypothetical protein